mmetsp:Transcript_101561/g.296043  ORF Transcript_101561/g.296043 Transcript_101561/m.296043 type:complete len:391 (+) Transcript_101561:31-1203(+)
MSTPCLAALLLGMLQHCRGIGVDQIMTSSERAAFSEDFPELSHRATLKDRTSPGLGVSDSGGYTPQGITFVDNETVLISLYWPTGKVTGSNSLFAAIPRTGDYRLLKVFELTAQDGSALTLHVGGMQRTAKYVWTCEANTIYAFAMEDVERGLAAPDGRPVRLAARHAVRVDARASWVSRSPEGTVPGVDGEVLWAGDFAAPGFPIAEWHKSGWMAGYRLDPDTGLPSATISYPTEHGTLLRPDAVVFLGHTGIQGGAACRDKVFTSVSFVGRYARLRLFGAPFAEAPAVVQLPNNVTTLGWELDASQTGGMDVPAMSEDLDIECTADGQASRLAVNFESASITYRYVVRALLGYIEDRWFDVDVMDLPVISASDVVAPARMRQEFTVHV